MKAIIVGCGRIGFNNLPPDFQGRIHEGDAMNQDVLSRAGIAHCDALAAVTNNDALNAVVCHIAKVEYKVPNIIARNYDPHVRSLFESFNIQVVSSTSWGAQRIEELLTDTEGRTVFSAGNGEVEVYELPITSALDQKEISELMVCNTCVPLAITRAGRAFIPESDSIVQTDDLLTVAATFDGIQETREHMKQLQKEG
jgi:trk system potassium uptake protein TrkA